MLLALVCMLYVIALTTCLGVAALLVERALPSNAPRRWVWSIAILLSMVIPPVYQAKHTASLAGFVSATGPTHWAWLEAVDPVVRPLWLAASALLLLWCIGGAWQLSRIVRRERGTTVVDGVRVVVTRSAGPATVGFWRSRVLLPRWVLGLAPNQRLYVIRHEEEHRRAHDGRLLFVASLLLLLAPWNVALWWLVRRLSLAVEIDCDHRVVRALGDADAYGELLLKVAMASNGPRLQPGLTGGAAALERRLVSLVAPARLPRMVRCLLPVLAIGILILALSAPHPTLGAHANHVSEVSR